jgi:O-antigen/teichoic acid export membrane protein
VTIIEKLSTIWKEDHLLRRVVKNGSHLFSSNVVFSGLSFLQTIVALRLIGINNWGIVAVVQTFASNIHRLLSFRMSEVVVKHLGAALGREEKEEAAVLVKAAGLTEAVTSILAAVVLTLLTPWAARVFVKDPAAVPWLLFYGLMILISNLVFETSTGVLQATHRFDRLARVNQIQSLITFSLIAIVYGIYRLVGVGLYPRLLPMILTAYVAGKAFMGVAQVVLAARELNSQLGRGWWRIPLRILADKRGLAVFALNTNLNGTVNVIFRDNIQLYLAWLLSPIEAGYFKTAMTLMIPITLILDPLIAPTYAEITRTVARLEWGTTLRLLKRVTAITAGGVAAIWAFWALIGWWIIPMIYKSQAAPVYPTLLILLLGYGFASVFQWNRSLFLSLGKAGYPVLIQILAGVVELALIFCLVPQHGHLMMAAILSGYFIVSIGINSARGWWEVRGRNLSAAARP